MKMESKIQKPSGLKPPIQITKSILPTDHIKAGFVANQTVLASKTFGSRQPLTRDLTNINGPTELFRGRALSPEPSGSKLKDTQTRAKLRRSRSACDIRDMTLSRKRVELRLPTIPAKVSRLMSTAASSCSSTASATVRQHVRSNLATTAAASTKRIGVTTTARPLAIRSVVASTGAAAKDKPKTTAPITKPIAPYDFKARFHDLLKKHKILKAKFEKQCEDVGDLESLPTQLEETQAKLIQTEANLKDVQTAKECLDRLVTAHAAKIDAVTSQLGNTKIQLESLQKLHTKITADYRELCTEAEELRVRNEVLEKSNTCALQELKVCEGQLFQLNMDRKELHNTVMDLRGNIRVFCRVRPPLPNEDNRLLCGWNYHDETTVEILKLDNKTKPKVCNLSFTFDQVFHPHSAQIDIFEMVSPLIQSALDGYNICIFAYGQTGSGKTYTMDGVPDNVGVIPRTVDLLFNSVKNYKNLGWEYEIKVTFLEIYNEVLYDLLSNEQKEMEIRIVKNNKNDIYISNITEETVNTAARLRELMQIAKMNRATASTVGNERSSRSHAVTKLKLIGKHAEKEEISVGTINLVDLAGSESPKTSIRMRETKNINRSLSELTNVILALLQKQDHIPYRNSKLTHLLMPSLGGNSKTLMFINVSPFQDCFQESVKSLRFAASVNTCKVSKAKRNRFLNSSKANSSLF